MNHKCHNHIAIERIMQNSGKFIIKCKELYNYGMICVISIFFRDLAKLFNNVLIPIN